MRLWVNILVEHTFLDFSAVAITALFFFSSNQAIRKEFSTLQIVSWSALWQ